MAAQAFVYPNCRGKKVCWPSLSSRAQHITAIVTSTIHMSLLSLCVLCPSQSNMLILIYNIVGKLGTEA